MLKEKESRKGRTQSTEKKKKIKKSQASVLQGRLHRGEDPNLFGVSLQRHLGAPGEHMLMPAQPQIIPAELISAQQPLCLAEDTPNQGLPGSLSAFTTKS